MRADTVAALPCHHVTCLNKAPRPLHHATLVPWWRTLWQRQRTVWRHTRHACWRHAARGLHHGARGRAWWPRHACCCWSCCWCCHAWWSRHHAARGLHAWLHARGATIGHHAGLLWWHATRLLHWHASRVLLLLLLLLLHAVRHPQRLPCCWAWRRARELLLLLLLHPGTRLLLLVLLVLLLLLLCLLLLLLHHARSWRALWPCPWHHAPHHARRALLEARPRATHAHAAHARSPHAHTHAHAHARAHARPWPHEAGPTWPARSPSSLDSLLHLAHHCQVRPLVVCCSDHWIRVVGGSAGADAEASTAAAISWPAAAAAKLLLVEAAAWRARQHVLLLLLLLLHVHGVVPAAVVVDLHGQVVVHRVVDVQLRGGQ
jgi:hypothetical protein